MLTNDQKSTIRRAALKNGERTTTWDESEFLAYVENNTGNFDPDFVLSLNSEPKTKLDKELVARIWDERASLGLPNKKVTHIELAQWVADSTTRCPYSLFSEFKTEAREFLDAKGESYSYTRNDENQAIQPTTGPEPEPTIEPKKPETTTMQTNDIQAAITTLMAAMGSQGISEERVLELINQYSNTPRPIDLTIYQPEKEPVKVEGQHKDFGRVLRKISAGVNTVLVGPAGSGKSTIVENITKTLERDYYFLGSVRQPHEAFGFMDANGNYVSTPFRKAWEFGGVFCLEEMDGSNPNALLKLNNALAGNWCDFPDGMIKRHPNFVAIACANTFGTGANSSYVGRAKLDAASRDRFAFLYIDYDETLEMQIALATNPDAEHWVRYVQKARKAARKANLETIISPRASIFGAALLKAGDSVEECIESLIIKEMSDDNRQILMSAIEEVA